MRESYLKLLSVAKDITDYFDLIHFKVCEDCNSAFVDIEVSQSFYLHRLMDKVGGLRVEVYPEGDYILVRVYED